jgi:acyl-coenzyme A thioesterase PaaI-like protein
MDFLVINVDDACSVPRTSSRAKSDDAASDLRAGLAAPPFHRWLRPQLHAIEPGGRVTIRLPMRAQFRRDPQRPETHGGVIAGLIDIAGHAAVAAKLRHGGVYATRRR